MPGAGGAKKTTSASDVRFWGAEFQKPIGSPEQISTQAKEFSLSNLDYILGLGSNPLLVNLLGDNGLRARYVPGGWDPVTSHPLDQMAIQAGYDSGTEKEAAVFEDVVHYAYNEMIKGAVPNPMIKGTHPSKFALPLAGIPIIAYQMMNALQSGVTHITVVGTPDTEPVFDSFVKVYAKEIAEKGITFQFKLDRGSTLYQLRSSLTETQADGQLRFQAGTEFIVLDKEEVRADFQGFIEKNREVISNQGVTYDFVSTPEAALALAKSKAEAGSTHITFIAPGRFGPKAKAFAQTHPQLHIDHHAGPGGFVGNLAAGLNSMPDQNGKAMISFGDTPLIDLLRMVYDPDRRTLDYQVGLNARGKMFHDVMQNYHYIAVDAYGGQHAVKEGNLYIYNADAQRSPLKILQDIYEGRKSFGNKGKSRLRLLLETPFSRVTVDPTPLPEGKIQRTFVKAGRLIGPLPSAADLAGALGLVFFDSVPFIARMILSKIPGLKNIPVVKAWASRWRGIKVPRAKVYQPTAEHMLQNKGLNIGLSVRHTDPGGVHDFDGFNDVVLGMYMIEKYGDPSGVYPYWEQLQKFKTHPDGVPALKQSVPSMNQNPQRFNDLYLRMYDRLQVTTRIGNVRRGGERALGLALKLTAIPWFLLRFASRQTIGRIPGTKSLYDKTISSIKETNFVQDTIKSNTRRKLANSMRNYAAVAGKDPVDLVVMGQVDFADFFESEKSKYSTQTNINWHFASDSEAALEILHNGVTNGGKNFRFIGDEGTLAQIRGVIYEIQGLTQSELKAKGFNPDLLPMDPSTGSVNERWLAQVFSERELKDLANAQKLYHNRRSLALGLDSTFAAWLEATEALSPPKSDKVTNPGLDPDQTAQVSWVKSVRERGNLDALASIFDSLEVYPNRSRGLIIGWDFGRLQEQVLEAIPEGERKSAESAFSVALQGNADTPLRRVLMGFKAVDALIRSLDDLSPEEFKQLYPKLKFALRAARNASALFGKHQKLLSYFVFYEKQIDRDFLNKTGELAPEVRTDLNHGKISSVIENPRAIESQLGKAKEGPLQLEQKDFSLKSLYYDPFQVSEFARRIGILESRIPHLIARAQTETDAMELVDKYQNRMTLERLNHWLQSENGQKWLHGLSAQDKNTLKNRIQEGGPALATSILALMGFELIADAIGLDLIHHKEERFLFVVAGSHLVNKISGAAFEVKLNRQLKAPFDFVTTRTVNSASGWNNALGNLKHEGQLSRGRSLLNPIGLGQRARYLLGAQMDGAVQFTFEKRATQTQAIWASLFRNFSAGNAAVNLAKLSYQVPMGMGPGLASSALFDRFISEDLLELKPDSRLRHTLSLGAFFLPDLHRILAGPHKGLYLFRSKPIRWGTKAFGIGFMVDFLWQGSKRWKMGSQLSHYMDSVKLRAKALKEQELGSNDLSVNGALALVAPQSSLDLEMQADNEYVKRVLADDAKNVDLIIEESRVALERHLLEEIRVRELDPEFYSEVDFSFLRTPYLSEMDQDVKDYLNNNPDLLTDMDSAQARILEQFPRLNELELESVFREIYADQMRTNRLILSQIELPKAKKFASYFDESGQVRSGKELDYLSALTGEDNPVQNILNLRKSLLAMKIMKLSQSGQVPQEYLALGEKVGLLNNGTFVASELTRRAFYAFADQNPDFIKVSGSDVSSPKAVELQKIITAAL